MWRGDPGRGPADVIVPGGGADGVGFKALDEVQPSRSRGGIYRLGVCWLEHGGKIAVQTNSLRRMFGDFSEWGRNRKAFICNASSGRRDGVAVDPGADGV